jgi:F-type H+-transporting ATPase subunit b
MRAWRLWLVGFVPALLLAVPAVAAEEGESNIFNSDIGNFLVTTVVFALVIIILGKYAWKPLLNVLHERERTIRDSIESARREREEAQRLLDDYKRQLEQARQEATAIVEEGRRDSEAVRQRIQAEARQQADEMIERARREIRLATDTAVKELYDQTADLAVQVASGILKREIKPDEHRDLVQQSLERMKSEGQARLN